MERKDNDKGNENHDELIIWRQLYESRVNGLREKYIEADLTARARMLEGLDFLVSGNYSSHGEFRRIKGRTAIQYMAETDEPERVKKAIFDAVKRAKFDRDDIMNFVVAKGVCSIKELAKEVKMPEGSMRALLSRSEKEGRFVGNYIAAQLIHWLYKQGYKFSNGE